MKKLISSIIFFLFVSVVFGQNNALGKNNYSKIVLDGKEAYMNKTTNQIFTKSEYYRNVLGINLPVEEADMRRTTSIVTVRPDFHKVLEGETYYSISRQYGISVDELLLANNRDANTELSLGEELLVKKTAHMEMKEKTSVRSNNYTTTVTSSSEPAPNTYYPPTVGSSHTVVSGDTLYNIAKRNGITVEELSRLNGINGTTIKIGQVLKVR